MTTFSCSASRMISAPFRYTRDGSPASFTWRPTYSAFLKACWIAWSAVMRQACGLIRSINRTIAWLVAIQRLKLISLVRLISERRRLRADFLRLVSVDCFIVVSTSVVLGIDAYQERWSRTYLWDIAGYKIISSFHNPNWHKNKWTLYWETNSSFVL